MPTLTSGAKTTRTQGCENRALSHRPDILGEGGTAFYYHGGNSG